MLPDKLNIDRFLLAAIVLGVLGVILLAMLIYDGWRDFFGWGN